MRDFGNNSCEVIGNIIRQLFHMTRGMAVSTENTRQRLLEKIMPELPLTDVATGVKYYRDDWAFESITSRVI